jgi:carbonic anhydrase/acetyltransferase-like protein (isoleucine patch superfamily)
LPDRGKGADHRGRIIPDNSLVIGMPGRVSRELSTEEIDAITQSARGYAADWKRYATGRQPIE